MRYFFAILLTIVLIGVAACGESDSFVIEGSIEGAEAQSVTLSYYAEGGLKTSTMSLAQGKFRFAGRSARPTLAVITAGPDNQRYATLIVSNGDRVTVKAKLDEPYATVVDGNSDSEAAANWVKENVKLLKDGNAALINRSIAEYVSKNPSKLSSTALLSAYFQSAGYESTADSLFSLLAPEVRTPEMTQNFNAVISAFVGASVKDPIPFLTLYGRNDSMVYINPIKHSATMLCFVDEDKRGRDSVARVLRDLSGRYDRKRLVAVELSTAADSASWRSSLGRDTVGWVQTWLPGSVAAAPVRRMGVSRVPYFIVADSSGAQIYRGPSVSQAQKAVDAHLK